MLVVLFGRGGEFRIFPDTGSLTRVRLDPYVSSIRKIVQRDCDVFFVKQLCCNPCKPKKDTPQTMAFFSNRGEGRYWSSSRG